LRYIIRNTINSFAGDAKGYSRSLRDTNALSQYARLFNETPLEAARNTYTKISTAGSVEVCSPLKSEGNTNAQNDFASSVMTSFPVVGAPVNFLHSIRLDTCWSVTSAAARHVV
jgi:hypothetical protein